MMRRAGVPSLFPPGALPGNAAHGGVGDITLAMEVLAETDKAWLVKPSGERGSARAKWLPKSLGSRGEGEAHRRFTMKRFTAHERGWL